MKTTQTNEMSLMRSKALTVVVSMVLSALMLLPIFASAKGKETESNGKVFIHPMKNNAQAAVTLADFGEGNYVITVESNETNDVHLNKMIQSPAYFSKVFDFSTLEDGEYTLRVQAKKEVKESSFTISNGQVIVAKAQEVKPQFQQFGQKAVLQVENPDCLGFTVRVTDENGQNLFSTYAEDSKIGKLFDFSEVAEGNYHIAVSSNKQEFAFDFVNEQR